MHYDAAELRSLWLHCIGAVLILGLLCFGILVWSVEGNHTNADPSVMVIARFFAWMMIGFLVVSGLIAVVHYCQLIRRSEAIRDAVTSAYVLLVEEYLEYIKLGNVTPDSTGNGRIEAIWLVHPAVLVSFDLSTVGHRRWEVSSTTIRNQHGEVLAEDCLGEVEALCYYLSSRHLERAATTTA